MNICAYIKEDQLKLISSLHEQRSDTLTFTKQRIDTDYLKGDILMHSYSGLCCVEYDLEILQDCHERIIIDSEFVQISFALAGKSLVIKKDHTTVKMKSKHVQLAFLNNHTVDIKMLQKEKKVSHIRLIISRDFFLQMMLKIGWNIEESFINKIINGEHFRFGDIAIATEMEILSSLKAIFSNDYPHPLNNIFFNNKINEILMRIHHLFEIKKNYSCTFQNSLSETKQLEKAKIYIEEHYNNHLTIKELSKKIYLNEFKLKKGFKQLHGYTIHEYITNTRMAKAKEFLSQNLQVSEVGTMLGYKTSSHFIQIFKRYFGHTPKQLKVLAFFLFNNIVSIEC